MTPAEILYSLYPRKVGRLKALRAIQVALKKAPYEVLHEAVTAYAEARKDQDIQFTPHPATWFNQGRWEDDRANWTDRRGSTAVSKPATPARHYDSSQSSRIAAIMAGSANTGTVSGS